MPPDSGQVVRTTCPYCGVGCGVLARATGLISAEITGDPAHPANFGRLCSKGSSLGETLSLDGRLLYPEIEGHAVPWDAALGRIADGLAETIAAHGPDSVALYVSGQLLTEDYYAANKFAKGYLGTANIDSNSRLCMSSAVAGHRRAFGEDIVPGIYEDLEQASLIVLVGSNTAWCHPVVHQRILAARAKRPDMRIVVIDPRRTATCEGADLHLQLRPGSDVALFLGLLVHLWDGKHTDARFIKTCVLDAEDALATARATAPDVASTAALCGLRPEDVARFFAWFAAMPRTVSLFSQGVNQSSAGTDKVNAIINVHLATGRIGKPGAAPFSITGQPNAMGGREVGALANLLAAHLEWTDRDVLRRYWAAPNLAHQPGQKAVDLFRRVADGQIKAVWIFGTNPAISMPDAAAVRAGLARCPLVIVSDIVRESDTSDRAHIRLPALAWGEKNGTVTNSERVISRQRPFLPLPGQARPDWWAIAQVARRLGYDDGFAWRGPADIFREHAALSGFENHGRRVFDISALATLSDADYDALRPTRWPCPETGGTGERLYGSGDFSLPGGKARMIPTAYRRPVNTPDEEYRFVLLTGRVRDQWHTMTRTGKAARLLAHRPEPFVQINPADAGDLRDGGLAVIESRWGRAILRVQLDPAAQPGTVYAPMHWTDRFCPAGRINPVVNAETDPVSGQPELKHTPVSVKPYEAAWHGFLLARRNIGPRLADWCTVLPASDAVWRHELAGLDRPERALARIRTLAGGGAPEITLRDEAAGLFRTAFIREGRLIACLFIGPEPALPPRDWLVGLFRQECLATSERRALLTGRPAEGPAPEAPVCVCHGIGARAIVAAIAAGFADVEAIGRATGAGTNCGSCRPEIRALLAERAAAEELA